MDAVRAVEAILFSSSRPLRAVDIAERAGISQSAARRALRSLGEQYDSWGSSVQVLKTGPTYSLAVREEYAGVGDGLAEQELPRACLKTAALIGYYQPVRQSELVKMRGPRAYEDVRTLRQMRLVTGRNVGQTQELTTTHRFCEYFGIPSTKREDIREWLEGRIGQ